MASGISLSDAVGRFDDSLSAGVFSDGHILFYLLLVFIGALVVEVKKNGRVAQLLGAQAEIDQAFSKLAVLSAVVHLLVEAIDGQCVGAPSRGVAAVPAGTSRRDVVQQPGIEWAAEELGALETVFQSALVEPAQAKCVAAFHVGLCNAKARVHRQFEVAAREEVALLGMAGMRRYKILAGDAVLVGKDEIVGLGSYDGLVEYLCFLETLVFVPHVLNGQLRLEALYQLAGVVARAVVGNDNLVGGACLIQISPQRFLQPARIVVGGDDDANGEILLFHIFYLKGMLFFFGSPRCAGGLGL